MNDFIVPVILGNEYFVVTQEDIRHVEDTRILSYNKLLPNGELMPLDFASVEALVEHLNRAIQGTSTPTSFRGSPVASPVINLNHVLQSNLSALNYKTEPMELSTSTTVNNSSCMTVFCIH